MQIERLESKVHEIREDQMQVNSKLSQQLIAQEVALIKQWVHNCLSANNQAQYDQIKSCT